MEITHNLTVILSPTYRRNAHWRELYQALGLNPNKHLPDEGLPAQRLANVTVWVESKADAREAAQRLGKRFIHRVMCTCPKCLSDVPAGRLFQHRCKDPALKPPAT